MGENKNIRFLNIYLNIYTNIIFDVYLEDSYYV